MNYYALIIILLQQGCGSETGILKIVVSSHILKDFILGAITKLNKINHVFYNTTRSLCLERHRTFRIRVTDTKRWSNHTLDNTRIFSDTVNRVVDPSIPILRFRQIVLWPSVSIYNLSYILASAILGSQTDGTSLTILFVSQELVDYSTLKKDSMTKFIQIGFTCLSIEDCHPTMIETGNRSKNSC